MYILQQWTAFFTSSNRPLKSWTVQCHSPPSNSRKNPSSWQKNESKIIFELWALSHCVSIKIHFSNYSPKCRWPLPLQWIIVQYSVVPRTKWICIYGAKCPASLSPVYLLGVSFVPFIVCLTPRCLSAFPFTVYSPLCLPGKIACNKKSRILTIRKTWTMLTFRLTLNYSCFVFFIHSFSMIFG